MLVKRCRDGEKLPTRATENSSGLDLYASNAEVLAPGDTKVIWTGVAVHVRAGLEAQVRGRSSLSRKGILCALGTIDQDYRGEIGVNLTNTSPLELRVERGDRIAQLVVAPVVIDDVIEVDELSETERGERGFGSTGK